ncbi:MAG: methyltransferase domain-containing protein [Syntrophaceae bacterium]|nr:methyltransferase domain-containing protein [Syntrophaceae bacterium]
MEQRDFNKDAATWDENPGRIKAANDIADTMLKEIRFSPEMDVLDFGCGTGLVTLRLSPFARYVTGVDSSTGMLDILKAKIEKGDFLNVQTRYLDPEKWDLPNNRYDLAIVVMTLHHVPEIAPLLERLAAVLVPGGRLCIADLDLDDGQFHSDNTGVFHFGFAREQLSSAFMQAGLEDVRVCTAAQVVKPTKTGTLRTFTVFLMIGTKNKQ